jgi:hypothetical protein
MTFLALLASSFMTPTIALAETGDPNPQSGGGVVGDSFFVGIIAPGQSGGSGAVSADEPNGPPPYRYT